MERGDGGLTIHSVDCKTGKAHHYTSSTIAVENKLRQRNVREGIELLYRVYKKKLNKFEIALNVAKRLKA